MISVLPDTHENLTRFVAALVTGFDSRMAKDGLNVRGLIFWKKMMRRSWLMFNLLQNFLVRDRNKKLIVNFQPNSYATRFQKLCVISYQTY